MSEAMWVWDYELKTLGSWPSTGYNGHNTPVEVVTQMDVKTLRDERDRLRTFLDEALEEWEYSCQYKSEYLREKHGDLERIAEIKAALTPAGQRWTRSTPTEPGWYWWRTVNGDSAVRIIHTHEGGLLIQFEGGHVTHLHRVTLGEWQGPLTPNEETE